MKKLYIILPCLLALMSGCKKTEPVGVVTSSDFIDPGFYGYMQANYDTNGDYVFQPEEIAAVKNLDLTKEDYIINLKGIEKFTELEKLNIDYLKIQTNDLVITNPKLKELSCGYVGLNNLDVLQCPDLEYLACYGNNFSILDVDNNVNLKDLYCQKNIIRSINLKNCKNLEHLRIADNPLTSLDLSGNPMLNRLYFSIDKFWELDISNNPKLDYIEIKEPLPTSGIFTIYLSEIQELPHLGGAFTPGATFDFDIIRK